MVPVLVVVVVVALSEKTTMWFRLGTWLESHLCPPRPRPRKRRRDTDTKDKR